MSYSSKCPACRRFTETDARDWRLGRLRPKCSACGATLESRGAPLSRKKIAKPAAKKPRRRKRRRGGLKPSAQRAFDQFEAIAKAASEAGIRVEHRVFDTCHRPSIHVMFNALDGKRLADYWPGNCSFRLAGLKLQKVDGVWSALGLVVAHAQKLGVQEGSALDREFQRLIQGI